MNAESKHRINHKNCSVKEGRLETSENFLMLKLLLHVDFNLFMEMRKIFFIFNIARRISGADVKA